MLRRSLVLSIFVLTLTACNFSGTTEKGPFSSGSSVTASQLDGQAQPISSSTKSSSVISDKGGYSIGRISWNGWTQLQVTGQFYDEFTGETSSDAFTLDAITKKDRSFDRANIHLFSHLAASRIRQRVANGQNLGSAWKSTQNEMKNIFGLPRVSTNYHRGVEQLSLSSGRGRYRKENANLLLFTGSFLAVGGNASTLASLTADFVDDGQFNGVGADIFHSIAVKASTEGLLTDLSNNLSALGVSNPPNNGDMPSLPQWVIEGEADNTPPVITVVGENPVEVEQGSVYSDEGATAIDNVDGAVVATLSANSDAVDTSTQAGTTFTIEYEATDIAGNSATATRTVIIIAGANQVPVAENQTVIVDEDTTNNQVTLTGSDGDEDVLSFDIAINTGPNNGTLSGVAPDLFYTPDENFFGTDSFEFTVNDGTDTSNVATITLTVNPINDAPTVNAGSDVSVDVGDEVTLEGIGLDIDGDDLSYSWSEDGVELATTASFDYLAETGGTHNLTITVSDGIATATDDVVVNVNLPDLYQIVFMVGGAPLPNSTTVVQKNLSAAQFTEDVLLLASVVDSDGNTIDSEPDFDIQDVDLTTPNSVGYDLVFSFIDPFQREITNTLKVIVLNSAPRAVSQNITVDEDSVDNAITLVATDSNGDAITYTTTVPNNGVLSGTPPSITYTPFANFEGIDRFTFTASDGIDSSTVMITVTVTGVNDLPMANAGTDATVDVGTVVTLTGSGSDIEDGNNVSFSWVEEGNATVLSTSASFNYTPNSEGSHNLVLTVTDSDGGSTSDTVVVIAVNSPPIAAAQNITVDEDSVDNAITLVATDSNGDALTYTTTVPNNGNLSGTPPSITYTPFANFEGIDTFTFTASDGTDSSTATITVTVTGVNDLPTANAGTDATVDVGTVVTLTGSGSDVEDGNNVSFSWVEEGNATVLSTSASFNYTPNSEGSHNLVLTVTDSDGGSASDTVVVMAVSQSETYACASTLLTEGHFQDSFITAQVDDIAWPLDNLQAPTVLDIEEAFNAARYNELLETSNLELELFPSLDRTKLKMPTQAVWDAYSDSEKALYLINSERCSRRIRPYEGIAPEVIVSPAQTYAQFLADNDVFGHNEDGRTPWQRLAEDASVVVGDTADFFNKAENLAFVSRSSTGAFPVIRESVARSIYSYMYADKNATIDSNSGVASYGHRAFVLATGLVENSGEVNQEGLIGLGRAEVQSVVNFNGTDFNQTKVYSVMNGFDPNETWNMSNIQSVNLVKPDTCLVEDQIFNNTVPVSQACGGLIFLP